MIRQYRETFKVPKLLVDCCYARRPVGVDPDWIIDRMTRDDLSSILVIEQDSQPDPWTDALFLEELERPYAHVLVARNPQKPTEVLGYICFWEVADEIQILNVAVHSAHRRQGIGHCLMREALRHGIAGKSKVAALEVRQSNISARRFYEDLGFQVVGVRPHYYGPGASALLMELNLLD